MDRKSDNTPATSSRKSRRTKSTVVDPSQVHNASTKSGEFTHVTVCAGSFLKSSDQLDNILSCNFSAQIIWQEKQERANSA